jgi:hypothetical protein
MSAKPRRRAAAALLLLCLGGCSLTMYERGLIQRVDATRHTEAGAVSAVAARVGDGAVRVVLRQRNDVAIERQKIYQTIVSEAGWAPWAEPLELITSPLYLPITMVLAAFALDDTPDRKIPTSSRLKIAFSPINPFVSIFGMRLRRTEISDEVHFRGKRRTMRFAMHMPVAERALRWQALDAGGAVVASGEAESDPFGRLLLAGVPATAAALRVEGEGVSVTAPLAADQ